MDRKSRILLSRRLVFLFAAALVPWSGCMAPVKAAGGLAQAVTDTTLKATKASGTFVKSMGEGTAKATSTAWKSATRGFSPDLEPPSDVP